MAENAFSELTGIRHVQTGLCGVTERNRCLCLNLNGRL